MSDELLSASGEAAWQALRQHIEWTQGFWSGWVFTDYTPSVHELHRRVEALLRGVGRKTVLRQPREPGELVDVLLWLNAGADGCDGCVIVAVVQSGEAWRDAWEQLMLRLNERRELLRANIRGGLLMCAPMSFKVRTREAAPDLWSIRSLALEISPVVRDVVSKANVPMGTAEPEKIAITEAELVLALQAVTTAQRAAQPEAEVDARIRAAEALFDVGRRTEAYAHAALAVERAPSPEAKARALVVLATLERNLGDFVAAERHYRLAIDVDSEAAGVWALFHFTDLLRKRQALSEARAIAEEAVVKVRSRPRKGARAPDRWRDEAASLERLGEVKRAQGDVHGAEVAFAESLALTKRWRGTMGDSTNALRDEAISLGRLGDVKRELGDLSSAREVYDLMLSLSRRRREMLGDTEDALSMELAGLDRVGGLQRQQGELGEALKTYGDLLELCQRYRVLVGDTENAIRNESVGLAWMGDLKRQQGDLKSAEQAYEASLALNRRKRQLVGDTADALRDEGLSMERVGDLKLMQGDIVGARGAYEASLDLSRKIREMVGDTVETLEDVASDLYRYATVEHRLGHREAAKAAFTEAAHLWREVQVRCGSLPRNVDALSNVLETLRALETPL